MDTHLLKTLEPDSVQNLDGSSLSLIEETLDVSTLVSLSSNPNGSPPILNIFPCSLETPDGSSSSSPTDSSTEETETVDNDLSRQSLVWNGPNQREGTSDLDGSLDSLRIHENPLYSAVKKEGNDEDIYSDMIPLCTHRQHTNSCSEKLWPSNNSLWSPRKELIKVKPTGVGAGLENLGNTCFINAIMQCFTHTVPLVEALRSCNHAKPCNGATKGFCVICTLCEHVELSLASSGKVISPSKLVENLNYISSSFERYQQEDAHEFLQCLLDKLERCCSDSKKMNESLSSQDDNIVEQIFGGRLISKLRCCNCGHCSDTYEPLIDLSLEIEDVDSLQAALASFTKLEKIEDLETKFTCENCKKEVSVEKQLMLDRAPLVAAFHLKRFKTDGSYVVKIDKHLEFPLELDLQPYTYGGQNSDVELKYHLYAIVEHTGYLPTCGHYFSYIRSSPDTWHMLNDSRVTRIEEKSVLSEDAYILFYAKQGTAWVSSLLGAEKSSLDRNISNLSPKSVLDNVESDCTSYCGVRNVANCEADEFRDSSRGSSTRLSCETVSEAVQVNENRDAVQGFPAYFTLGSMQNVTELETRADTLMIDASKPFRASDCQDGVFCKEKAKNMPSLEEIICNQGIDKVKSNGVFHPLTPPRSPSLDDYSGKPSETCHVPRKHLKLESQVSCKRPLERGGKDLERQEAMRYLKRRTVPGSRHSKLEAAIYDGPFTKRNIKSSPCKRASPPSARRKQNHGSVMRRVAI